MSGTGAGRLAGSVRWAVIPFAPAPPFRLYAGTGTEPIAVADADSVIGATRRGGDSEFSFVVPGKARPVLLLSDPPAEHHREVTALRLMRLSKLTADEQQRVRAQQDELLFFLPTDRFALSEESAALVTALVRLHVDAIGTGPALGQLESGELSLIGERIVRFYRFDLRLLIERSIRELAERRLAASDADE